MAGTELLIFSEYQQRLFRLNGSAAFIWLGLEDQLDEDEVVESLVSTFEISKSKAIDDLQNILQQWLKIGIITQNKEAVDPSLKYHKDHLPPLRYPRKFKLEQNHELQLVKTYALIDCVFQIRFADDALFHRVQPLLQHLEVNGVSKSSEFVLDVQENHADFILLRDEELVDYCTGIEGVVPMIHANTLMMAYSHSDSSLAIHAGAIARNQCCIILPAISGSGKSTLTAALLHEGYTYFSDDLVLLTADHLLRPVPVSLGLKQGTWPILQSLFPSIENLNTHCRADKQLIRYLPPPKNNLPAKNIDKLCVTHMVFPHYDANSSLNIQKLTPADALVRMTEAGYDTNNALNRQQIESLVEWISRLDCYAIVYNSLTDAVDAINTLSL